MVPRNTKNESRHFNRWNAMNAGFCRFGFYQNRLVYIDRRFCAKTPSTSTNPTAGALPLISLASCLFPPETGHGYIHLDLSTFQFCFQRFFFTIFSQPEGSWHGRVVFSFAYIYQVYIVCGFWSLGGCNFFVQTNAVRAYVSTM